MVTTYGPSIPTRGETSELRDSGGNSSGSKLGGNTPDGIPYTSPILEDVNFEFPLIAVVSLDESIPSQAKVTSRGSVYHSM